MFPLLIFQKPLDKLHGSVYNIINKGVLLMEYELHYKGKQTAEDLLASTIRNFDRSGKLKAIRHPVNNYRLYDCYELETLLGQIMSNNPSETRKNGE